MWKQGGKGGQYREDERKKIPPLGQSKPLGMHAEPRTRKKGIKIKSRLEEQREGDWKGGQRSAECQVPFRLDKVNKTTWAKGSERKEPPSTGVGD